MDIKLYVNNSETNQIGKSLTNEIVYTGSLRGEASVIKPTMLVEAENISNYNYAYIPEFNRYYFIKEIVSVRTGLWRLSLRVDVLESFKESIKNLAVIIKNTEVIATNNYMGSHVWQTNVKNTTTIVNFPDGLLDDGEFILITAGG